MVSHLVFGALLTVAQQPVQVAPATDCPDPGCGYSLATEVELEPTGRSISIGRTNDSGRTFAVIGSAVDQVLVFTPDGTRTSSVAYPPVGSYVNIYSLVPAADSMIAFDRAGPSLSVIDRNLRVARTERFPMPVFDAVRLGDDAFLVNAEMNTPERVGLPLHVVRNGEIVRSFGSAHGVYRPDFSYLTRREVALASSGELWAARKSEYRLESWGNSDEAPDKVLAVDLPGFEPWSSGPRSPSDGNGPRGLLEDLSIDEQGYLRVIVTVRDVDWRDAASLRGEGASSAYLPTDLSGYFDSYVDIIDPVRGVLVARLWSDAYLTTFLDPEHAIANVGPRESPRTSIVRIQVKRP